MGNPIKYIDPDGRSVEDIIEVDSGGDIVNITRTEGNNVFIDSESGQELNLHDANGADSDLLSRNFEVGEQLFIGMSKGEVNEMIADAGTEPKELKSNLIPGDALFKVKELSTNSNKADFPMMLAIKHDLSSSIEGDSENGYFTEVTGSMIKFDGDNTLYNPSDAGQYLWGTWMKSNDFSLGFSKFGANVNEASTGGDSDADQRAIENGFGH